jgi:Flp pilus assembly protein CpaB
VKRSNRLVILVGLLLAVLAFVAIVILLNQEPEEVAPEEVGETVLVATRNIDIGEPVTPDLVEEREVDPDAVVRTPLRSASQLQGQLALFPVPEGSQVTAEAIGAGDGVAVNIAAQLNPGEKAISFLVDPATGLDFLIKPGDYIDIVMGQQVDVLQETADSASNPDENAPPRFESVEGLQNQRTVKVVLQDKRVLYVSGTKATQPAPQDTNNDGVINELDEQPEAVVPDSIVVVFAGSDQDAEVIKYAQNDFREFTEVDLANTRNIRTLTAVIRHLDDDEIEETTGITIDQLVDDYGLLIPGIVEDITEDETP